MFVERHQWLVSAGAGGGLYNLPDNDQSTVSAVVASTKQQLDQLQSQAASYAGRGSDYADARNGILQGFKSQLRSGLASPSSWPTLDAYMNSVVSPRISMVPLTVGGSNDCVQNTNCCPSGVTCQNMWSEVNFYGGGLGGRVDSWVEGPDAINFCSTVSGVKGTYIPATGSPADIGIPGGPTNTACNGGRAFKGYTTPTPQPGTYKIETFHSFTGNGQSFPPFSALLSSGSVPPPATWVFNTSNGYDMYQTPVGLSLQVAGAQMDETGQIATVSNCSSPIVVAVVFTPPVPDYNKPPTVTWGLAGSPGQDNLHRTVPCTVGTPTQITAAIGSLLLAQVQVQVQPSLTVNPTRIVSGAGSQFSLTATSTIATNGTYTWEIIAAQAGDDPTIAQLSQSPSCSNQPTCTATLQGSASGGKATIRVHFKSITPGVDITSDTRLIVVQISSVVATVASHVGSNLTKSVSTVLSPGVLQWPGSLWTGTTPLVLIRDSLPSISLQAFATPSIADPDVYPAIAFQVVRCCGGGGGPQDDAAALGTGVPSLTNFILGGASLMLNETGSFQVLVFVDSNGNGQRDDSETGVPLPVILVRATLNQNLSGTPTPIVTYQKILDPISSVWSQSKVFSGYTVCTTNYPFNFNYCAVDLKAEVDFVGGGSDGLRGVDQVFGGWVQNISAQDVVGSYQANHTDAWVFASNSSKPQHAPVFLPSDLPLTPAIVNPPVLDTVRGDPVIGGPAPGTGGDSSTTNTSRQVDSATLNLGRRRLVEMVDATAGGFPAAHYFYTTSGLTQIRYNLDFNSLLTVWSNVGGVSGPTGSIADRTYAVVLEQPWIISATFNADGQGNSMAVGTPSVTLGLGRAHDPIVPITTNGAVIMPPTAQNLQADDAQH